MHVLLVFSSSELGGAERSLTRMALAAMGEVEFTLATLDGYGPWADWCCELGAQPMVLGERDAKGGHGCFGFKALLRLLEVARRERYAAIYVIGLRASLWLRLMRPWLRGACIVHGIRWNPDSDSRLDRAFCLVERWLGGLIDLYICNSRIAADTLQRRAGVSQDKIRVVYNGLDRLPPFPDALDGRPMNVIVLANLSPRKGHLEFLDVVLSVRKRLPQVRFFFVGRDDMNGRLADEIAHHGLEQTVTLTGYQADVGCWLAQSRLMVLPSLWNEGCPTSILEAMAHGLPVVAFAIDGITELIDHQIDGMLIPISNYVGMTSAVELLLADSTLSMRFGQAGRTKVATRFGIAHSAEAHTSAFKEILRVTT